MFDFHKFFNRSNQVVAFGLPPINPFALLVKKWFFNPFSSIKLTDC